MTNEALQELIGSWFPNPKVGEASEHPKDSKNVEASEENQEEKVSINPSLLEFSEEASQFLNVTVPKEQLYDLMTKLKSNEETSFDYLFCLSGIDSVSYTHLTLPTTSP